MAQHAAKTRQPMSTSERFAGWRQVALAHAQARGWQLTEQPQRLNIQTIDSLALSIAYQTPLLSRLGGQLTPTEDVQPLYALAAERTLAHLGDHVTSRSLPMRWQTF